MRVEGLELRVESWFVPIIYIGRNANQGTYDSHGISQDWIIEDIRSSILLTLHHLTKYHNNDCEPIVDDMINEGRHDAL